MPDRPKLLLVPSISELEWNRVRSLVEDWAEVTTYDLPGLRSDEPTTELSIEANRAMINRGKGHAVVHQYH